MAIVLTEIGRHLPQPYTLHLFYLLGMPIKTITVDNPVDVIHITSISLPMHDACSVYHICISHIFVYHVLYITFVSNSSNRTTHAVL